MKLFLLTFGSVKAESVSPQTQELVRVGGEVLPHVFAPSCQTAKKKEGDYSVRTLEKRWNVLGETIKLTVLNLPTVIPVFDDISRSTAVVEILVLVDVGVIVVRET